MLRRVQNTLSHNYAVNPANYSVRHAWVGKGTVRYQMRIHGRGRAGKMAHPKAHLKITVHEKHELNQSQVEMKKLTDYFKKHELFVTMKDSKPVQPVNPVWSSKGWKYNYSEKWNNPQVALRKIRE
jgi:hypothetical protein